LRTTVSRTSRAPWSPGSRNVVHVEINTLSRAHHRRCRTRSSQRRGGTSARAGGTPGPPRHTGESRRLVVLQFRRRRTRHGWRDDVAVDPSLRKTAVLDRAHDGSTPCSEAPHARIGARPGGGHLSRTSAHRRAHQLAAETSSTLVTSARFGASTPPRGGAGRPSTSGAWRLGQDHEPSSWMAGPVLSFYRARLDPGSRRRICRARPQGTA